MLPYPNTMGLWPQFRSPLIWVVFAVSTYGTVSFLFWYVVQSRSWHPADRAGSTFGRVVYGIWRWAGDSAYPEALPDGVLLDGTSNPTGYLGAQYRHYGFAYALVTAVCSTIFPLFRRRCDLFRFAMVATIAILPPFLPPGFITIRHLDNMAKVMLAMGLIVAYGYLWSTSTPGTAAISTKCMPMRTGRWDHNALILGHDHV
jgi:molybdopterin-containing oxidoreductase family membrane subunit